MRKLFCFAICVAGLFGKPFCFAGTVTVASTRDSGVDAAGGLSLRQAVQDANAGDTIVFRIPVTDTGYNSATGVFTITLTQPSNGDTTSAFVIGKDLTIDGSGSKVMIARSSANGTPNFRIFNITTGTVTLSNLTITNGYLSSGNGAGIYNAGHLSIRGCAVTNNVTGNVGGGIENASTGVLEVVNSTFYGNTTYQGGRAIDNQGTARLIDSTVTANPAKGGIGTDTAVANIGTMRVGNTIIAGNPRGFTSYADTRGTFVSEGYNFIGDPGTSAGSFGAAGSHDQLGTDAAPADPKLDPVAFGIGPTPYFRPQPGSPVIDQGNRGTDANGQPVNVDQRGLERPIDQPTVANAGDASDIGAVEVGSTQTGPTYTVTTTDERNGGVCATDDCTLFDAINESNANADANTINFAPWVTGTIVNTFYISGLPIGNPVTINGPGASVLTISGDSANRIFNVASGVTASISGLMLANAETPGQGLSDNSGGAIENFGTLTLDRCDLINNYGGSGGAVANLGTLTVTNCTFEFNKSTGNGGALRNTGTMTVTNSTFYSNTSVNSGAISSFVNSGGPATATISNCTVTNNSATDANATGGGLNNGTNSTMNVRNTLVAFNTTPSAGGGNDVAGFFNSGGHNLIRTSYGSYSFTDGVNGDLVGSSYNFAFAGFGMHGGSMSTLALASGNSAINAGNDANAPPTDQRGYYRNGTSDIGAFEFNGVPPVTPNVTTGSATNITSTTATLNGTVNPNGLATSVTFVTDFGSFPAHAIGSGTADVAVHIDVTGLAGGTTYHFNVSATNAAGTTTGLQQAFTTATATPPSQLLNLSTRKQVGTDTNVLIGGFIVAGTEDKKLLLRGLGPSLGIDGALADPTLELHAADTTLLAFNDNWRDASNASDIGAILPPSNDSESAILTTLAAKPASQGGAGYTGVLAGKGGTTGIGLLEIYDVGTAANSKLANISTRGFVGVDPDLLIGGFIPGPSDRAPLKVLLRALGPSLIDHGVSGALADPVLELHDAQGTTLIANDNWHDASNASEIAGILPPPDDREAAILTTVPPAEHGYTAVVRGANSTTGVALVEVYALQ